MRTNPYQSRFLIELSKLSRKMVRELYTDPKNPLAEFKRQPTSAEWYLRNTLVSAGELTTLLSQLRYSLSYLSGYRRRRASDGELIVRSDYIAFMMENFLMRVGMVEDRSLKLANVVFRLGLPWRECRFQSIAKNDYVIRTASCESLR